MFHDSTTRLQVKTSAHRFLHLLTTEYHFAPRIAQALLEEAQVCLQSNTSTLRPGQIRVLVASRSARSGRPVSEIALVEVTLTLDSGIEDLHVLKSYGQRALRHVRIQRILGEALDQDGLATQEDLARFLHVSLRTIKRDFSHLNSQGIYLPTRGNFHGIGRGQTHKAQIIKRWLHGQSYDQICLRTYHTTSSIKRYVQSFLRVVIFHQQNYTDSQIAQLLQMGVPLVREYIHVYQQNDAPQLREGLAEHIKRLTKSNTPKKKGGQ